mgnify:CR=1 FL=1
MHILVVYGDKQYHCTSFKEAIEAVKRSNMFSEGEPFDLWYEGLRNRFKAVYGGDLISGDYEQNIYEMSLNRLIDVYISN